MCFVDLPVIVSGERYAFMDPLQIVWPGKTGQWWKLSELSGKPNALAGVLGICNFFPDCHDFSNKTLRSYITIKEILQEYPDGQIFKVSSGCSRCYNWIK